MTYSLVLTRGTHLIDEGTRASILHALDCGERTVDVALDRGHAGFEAEATVVCAHVVALLKHAPPPQDEEIAANVTPLRAALRPRATR
ncbi:MAG: hypothetical protein JOZ24_07555 [Candidatus Eremiobacteraeota bacterium]|nr:hypothetical protein [Candidatus Eremiobacteraeota bacterium]